VAPEYGGKGFGSEIMHALSGKNDKIYLNVSISNIKGQKFYRKMGFEVYSKGTRS